jgi:hypothetical protein
MQREDDLQYYYKRAETELERAQRAANPEAVKAHYLLAGYYLDRVYNQEASASHAH